MRKWTYLAGLLLPIGLAMPAAAQQPSKEKESKPAQVTIGARESKDAAATEDSAYIIGAEDVLTINVWKEPEITRTVPVRPDGKISLPLISDVQAAGLTPVQLATLITEKLRKFLTDPQVAVIVTTINSRRFYVLGEVLRPGAFQLLPNMSVLQGLSSAGGFSQFADLKNIYVLRYENGKQIKMPFNYKDVVKGQKSEQNILLKTGDTIVVP